MSPRLPVATLQAQQFAFKVSDGLSAIFGAGQHVMRGAKEGVADPAIGTAGRCRRTRDGIGERVVERAEEGHRFQYFLVLVERIDGGVVGRLNGATFLLFPWLSGHSALYVSALGVSKLRDEARVAMTKTQMEFLESLTDDELLATFKRFDIDGSNALDADELKLGLRVVLGVDLAIGDCEKLINQADRDGNGVVDFDEFAAICRNQV